MASQQITNISDSSIPSNSYVGITMGQPPQLVMDPSMKGDHKQKFLNMKVLPIRIFSYFCIVLGVASMGIHIAILVIYGTTLAHDLFKSYDRYGCGIWSGIFYTIAGSLGAGSTHQRAKSLLVGTVVFSSISIAWSIIVATLSGISADTGYGYYHGPDARCNDNSVYSNIPLCETWLGLEWSLMSVSILAFLCTTTLLILVSIPLCCRIKNKTTVASGFLQPYNFAGNEQPIYFQLAPQQITQQPATTNQIAYVGQPILQPTMFQQISLQSQK